MNNRLQKDCRGFSLSPSHGLSLPTYRVSNFANPEGIPQQSPGLRGTSNPGFVALGRANHNGVVSLRAQRGHNPVGVEMPLAREPRVTRRLATLTCCLDA